jgi:hypothetical protein
MLITYALMVLNFYIRALFICLNVNNRSRRKNIVTPIYLPETAMPELSVVNPKFSALVSGLRNAIPKFCADN